MTTYMDNSNGQKEEQPITLGFIQFENYDGFYI